jgi:toxin HigB-1
MRIITTKTFDKLFKKFDTNIQDKAAEKTELFKENPFNPILKTEKQHPKGHDVWSFRVDYDYRIVFKFIENDVAELRFVGHHNKIYNYPIFFN